MLDVEDESAAVALMEADLGVQAGVLVYELHAMRPYFDAFTNTRTERSSRAAAGSRTRRTLGACVRRHHQPLVRGQVDVAELLQCQQAVRDQEERATGGGRGRP